MRLYIDDDMFEFMFETPCPHEHTEPCDMCMADRLKTYIMNLPEEEFEDMYEETEDWEIPDWED